MNTTANGTVRPLIVDYSIGKESILKKGLNRNAGKKMVVALIWTMLLFFSGTVSAQVTIVSDGLNNSTTHFTITGGAYYSGNSAAADRVANSPFFSEGTHARGASSATSTLTSTANINLTSYTNATLSLRVAAFAIGGSNGNYGVEQDDYIQISISNNGGTSYTPYLKVTGFGTSSGNTNGSAWWSYAAGTGIATNTYGSALATFTPPTSGNQTTNGFSTMRITNLPSINNLRVRIQVVSTNPNERWVVDDFKITVPCSTPTAYAMTGGGSYCTGGAGVPIGLANSQTGVNYQLFRGVTAVGSPVAGTTGAPISFGNQTVAGTYTVVATSTSGGCTANMTGSKTVTVTPNNTITLTSASGTNNQTKCINTAITNITYSTTGATGATFSGLPTGVTGSWASNVVTITGTPSVAGTFNYTVTLTGGCGNITATGTITVNPNNTVSVASSSPTVCVNTVLSPAITHTTTGATGIGAATGLPAGVSPSFASNTITISGTPTSVGTFNYSIPLTGGCGTANATGTIIVKATNTIALTSASGTNNQTRCINTAITNITYSTTGATGATFSGLPTGVNGSWASNVVTISGTPSVPGTFSYTVTLTGGCGNITANGTITVTPNNTVSAASYSPTVCVNTALSPAITHTTTGVTGIGAATGLPSGVTASFASNTITISGTPGSAGTFNYNIPLTGGCGTMSATGTITVSPNNTILLTSGTGTNNRTTCINTAIAPITYSTTGATGATFAGLPTGVNGSWASNVVTISGSPSVSGVFGYTVTLTGGCGTVTATGTITVNTPPSFTACPSTLNVNTAANLCTAIVTYTATASGVPTPSLTYTFTGATTGSGSGTGSGSTFNKGTTNVVITASNSCPPAATCSFNVIVTDNQPPVITCPTPAASYNTDANECNATRSFTATATDNCGATTIAYKIGATTITFPYDFPVGSSVVTATATDGSGLTASCNFTVVVVDNQPPVITCPTPAASYNTDAGECNATLSFAATATDNCGPATIVYKIGATVITFPYDFPVGSTTVIATATDVNGLTASCNFTVVVVDNQPPVIICPPPVSSYNTDAGECNATKSFAATATDNCGVPTIVYKIGATTITFPYDFPVGSTTVTATATDVNGLISTCSFIVIVVDNQAPVFNCNSLSPISYFTDAPACSNDTNVPVPVASDNCSGSVNGVGTRSDSQPLNAPWPLGTTTITWTFTDASNNVTTCTQTVTVSDNDAPVLNCTSLAPVVLTTDAPACSNDTDVPVPVAIDNCNGSINGVGTRSDSQPLNAPWPLGTTTITWTFTDASSNQKVCTQTVTVTDNDAPVFNCNTLLPINYFTEAPACSNNTDVSVPAAIDNCNGSINGVGTRSDSQPLNAPWPLGTTTITWAFTDASNNVTTCTQTVTVSDNDAPAFNCNSLLPISYFTEAPACSNDTNVPVPVATDNCNGAINGVGTRSDNQPLNAPWPLGLTTITWTFTDAANNATTCTQTVTVSDNDAPVFNCNTLTAIAYGTEAPGCSNDTDVPVPAAMDNCNGSINGVGTRSDLQPLNAPWPLGLTTITWTFTDVAGNVTTCTQTVTVSDDDAPVFNCNSLLPISYSTEAPACSNGTDVPVPVAVDNCNNNINGVGTRSDSQPLNAPWPLGLTTITWTFTDAANNVTACTQTVTVTDDDAPVFNCNTLTAIAYGTEAPACSNGTDVPVPVAVDNCNNNINGVGTRSDSQPLTAPWPLGTTTITWTFTDAANNVTTCTQTVTVSDDDAPVFNCNSLLPVIYGTEAPACSNDTDVTVPVATDNCNGSISAVGSRSDSQPLTAPWPLGLTTITWTFTDAANNITSCTQTVTVNDDDAPVFNCNSLLPIVYTTEGSGCSNNTDVNVPVATDNCNGSISAVGTRSDSQPLNAPWPVGTTTITWTFTDAAGNATTCTQTVTVNDDDAPVFDCNSLLPITYTTEQPNCSNNTDVTVPVAMDICSGPISGVGTRSDNQPLNAPWPLGLTTITWTFTDASNNVTTCTQTVTVNDNDAPVFNCNSLLPIVYATEGSGCSNDTDVPVPVAQDNCNGAINGVGTRSDSQPLNAPWPVGTTTITWTFTDIAGNATVCSQTVTVNDDDAPVFDCNTLLPISYTTEQPNCSNNTDVAVPVAMDICSGSINGVGTRSDNQPLNAPWPLGLTTITWTFTDASNNVTTCTQTVTVNDDDAPVFVCNSLLPIVYTTEAPACTNGTDVPVPVAVDNCNNNINGVGTRSDSQPLTAPWPLGLTTITWTFTDAANNVTTCTQTVTVSDDDAPVFNCNSLLPINYFTEAPACSNDTDANVPVAQDNCNGVINGIGTRSDSQPLNAPWPLGTTTITWTFTDAANNVTTCTQTVTVSDNDAPVFDCNSLLPVIYTTEAPACSNDTDVAVPVAVDNCNNNINGVGTRSDLQPLTAPWPLGLTTITWTFTDAANNVTTCTQTVTVNDNDAPVFDCNNLLPVVYTTEAPACSNDTDVAVPVAVDNCNGSINGVGTRSDLQPLTAPWPLGLTTITWTFTDAANNVTTCTQTVTVSDNDAPVFDCNNLLPVVYTTEAPACSNDTDVAVPVAVDNCNGSINGVGTRSDLQPLNAPWPLGLTTITWTFTDAANNVTTCTQTVTVSDNDAPVFDCNSLLPVVYTTEAPACSNDTDVAVPVAADNCNGSINGVGTRSDLQPLNAPWPLGLTTITWTFTDAAGNVTTCTQTVTVNDDDAPVFDCNSLSPIVYTTEAPACSNDTDVTVPVAVDNCNNNISGVGVRSDSQPLNAPWPLGLTTITWTFTDAANNVTTCTQTVTVTDDDAPVFDCNSLLPIVYTTEAPACSNDTDVTVPVALDNCNGPINAVGTRSDLQLLTAPWPLGTTTITWTFTDAANNVTTCTQTVTVSDNDAPVFDCNSLLPVVYTTEAPACSNDTDVPVPVAQDNCNGAINGVGTRSDSQPLNDPWPLGTTTITWTFTDASNNVTTCTQTVTVNDNDAPVFDCNNLSPIVYTTEAPACSNDTDVAVPVAVDNCNGSINGVGTRSDNLPLNDPWPLGLTTITWTFTDAANNVTTCTQTVMVSDDDAPVFNCNSLLPIVYGTEAPNCSNDTDVPVPVAQDNCNGVINGIGTRSDLQPLNAPWQLGLTTITWTFTDAANNVTTCTQTVTVADDDAPVFNCNLLLPISYFTEAPACSNDTDVPVPVAQDNCNGAINGVGTRSDNLPLNDPWPLGLTTITWTFTDAANNVTTCTQAITVNDDDAPVFDCNSLSPIVYTTEAPACSNDTDVTVPVAIDNCNGPINAVGTRSDIQPLNAPWPLGTTTISWTFTDAANNVTTCTQTVTVNDDDAPVFDCNSLSPVVYTTEAPACSNDTDVTVPVAIDNCNGPISGAGTRSDSQPLNAPWPLGTTTITWTFTDAANNVTTCTQTVTVNDDDAPVFDCNNLSPVIYTTEAPACSNDTDVTVPVATDNCNGPISGVGTRSDSQPLTAPWPLGTTTISWTFTDAASNVTTCTQTVTVNDDDAPVFDCNTLTTISLVAVSPNCSNDTDVPVPVALDNCNGSINGVGTRSDSQPLNAPWPVGTTTITWTFTDAATNTTTCTQNVVVTANTTITATATSGGTISDPGATVVPCGGNKTYTMTASAGFILTNVIVDGNNVLAIPTSSPSTYTFTNVTSNHTIHAVFKQIVFADPTLVDVYITDLSNNPVNANLLPLNVNRRVHVPILNLDQAPANIIPSGTTKIRLDLGDKMSLVVASLATAPLSTYFTWTVNTTEIPGHDIIYGDQIADIPASFADDTYFEVTPNTPGTSKDTATFQVTNHNNPAYYLIDVDVTNNSARVNYTVLTAFTGAITNVTHVSCFGGSNGSITAQASGGASPYEYQINGGGWSAPTTLPHTFSGLTAGNYTIQARDFVGQVITLSPNPVVVTQPPQLVVNSVTQSTIACNGGTATVTISASGGTGTLTYTFNLATNTTGVFPGISAGTYSYSVTDANSCGPVTGSFTVVEPAPVVVNSVTQSTIACNGGTATVTISASGGTGALSYTFNAVTNNTGVFSGITAGTYSYSVTDANSCGPVTGSFTVVEPAVIMASGAVTSNYNGAHVSCNGSTDAVITITASGGTAPLSYTLSGGTLGAPVTQASNVFTGLGAGTYNYTVTDANSCPAATGTVTITQPTAVTGAVTSQTNITCAGTPTGSVTVTGSGGTPGYQYSLDGGAYQASGTFPGLMAGPHNVMVKDLNGCTSAPVTFTITEPTNPDVSLGSVFDTNLFPANGDEAQVVYNISELLGKAATPAILRVFKPSGYNITLPNVTTMSWGCPGFTCVSNTVDNPNWTITLGPGGFWYDIQRNSNTIACNEQVRVGIVVKRATTNISQFNLNAQFRLATGELIAANNNNSIVMSGE